MKMFSDRYTLGSFGLILAMAVAGLAVWGLLPAKLPVHWDIYGQPNGWWSRGPALFFLPALTAALTVLLAWLPRFDPLNRNIDKFAPAYGRFRLAFVGFMVYIHAATVFAAFQPRLPMTRIIMVGMVGLFWEMGRLLPLTKRNYTIGLRLPWTLESDEVWETTHRFGGQVFRGLAVALLVSLLLPEPWPFVLLIAGVFGAIGWISVYAYREHRRVSATASRR